MKRFAPFVVLCYMAACPGCATVRAAESTAPKPYVVHVVDSAEPVKDVYVCIPDGREFLCMTLEHYAAARSESAKKRDERL